MKNLNVNTVVANTPSDTDLLIEKLQNRIMYLESWLNSVLVRDELKRKVDLTIIMDKIKVIGSDNISYYILNNYDRKFFLNECDTEFKIELAQAILDYMLLIFPHYRNELLESIAQNKSEYADNFIFVEKL